jgi:predicted AlkP superfamily phosphohydrolase/phosphomutase
MVDSDLTQRKVVVLGWDGAVFELALRWAREGKLPALAGMLERGAYGRMRSTIPPVSAPAWASFVTGNNPGRHGIYYFKEHIPGTYESRLVCGADRRGKPLWRMLNEQGRTAGIVNLVMTYPPEPLDGFMISGMDTPGEDSTYTYPPELKEELLRRLGEYIIEPTLEEEARTYRYDALWDKIERHLENQIATARYLLEHKEWDVFAINFRATDSVQHHFWKFMEPTHPQYDPAGAGKYGDHILRVYQRLDEFAAEVRRLLSPEDVLIVMSDHGFGPTSDKVIYLNNWLAEQGWLRFRRQPAASPGAAGVGALLWRTAWERLRQMVPQRVKTTLERLAPRWYGRIRYPAAFFFIDWEHTLAYADEYQESIWINLAGREPQGTVQPGAEYEDLRRQILERLHDWKDPLTGEAVIEYAGLREEIYHGTELERAPDIILIPRQDPYYRVRPSHTSPGPVSVHTMSRQELQREYLPNGTHRLYGMLFVEGPGIAAGRAIERAEIVDMAPTILHLAGCAVPHGLDGRVLKELFTTPPAVRYCEGMETGETPAGGDLYDEEERAILEERLRGLGYLD